MVGLMKGAVCTAVLAAALAGCSVGGSSTPAQSSSGSNTGNGSNGGGSGSGPTFNVTVNFTGQDSLQGSFKDTQTGSGFSSCSNYASLVNANRPFLAPEPDQASSTTVQGKAVGYIVTVSSTSFHGPGMYTATMAGGVTVGSDSFLPQNNSTINVTVNSDGSGNASFNGFYQLSGSGNGNESGTMTWTCSG